MRKNKNNRFWHVFSQIALPTLTIGGQIAVAMKYPEFGLILNLIAQPFWLVASWRAWKDAEQVGMLINTVFFTIITAFGVVNYWLL